MSGDHNESTNETEEVVPPVEDIHLTNWSRWISEWQHVGNRISQYLDVPQETLLMNYGDDVRKVNEEKLLLEYAKIPTEFDKYRGNPDFFKLPCSLSKKFKCCPHEPKYFLVKTKTEKFEIPTVEFVETPIHIKQTEKNILDGARSIYQKWQNSKYRQQQLEKYASQIDKIVPHIPHGQNLIIIGQSLLKNDNEGVEQEEEMVSQLNQTPENLVSIKEKVCEDRTQQPRLWITINNIELNADTCNDYVTRKLHINFEYDIMLRTLEVKPLIIKNNGLVTIRISWKKIENCKLLHDYCEVKDETNGFYFNKNTLVVLPGQKIVLPIWFKVEVAATYSESWEIITEPRIWHSTFHMVLILHSYSYFSDLKLKIDSIIKSIDAKARTNCIKDILDELIVNRVAYNKTPIPSCVYDESQVFELANLVNDRPLFLFDEIVVNEVKDFYEILTGKTDWDYCVNGIKKIAHSRDVDIFLKNKNEEIAQRIIAIQNNETDTPEKAKPSKKKGDKKDKKEKKSKGKSSKKDKKSKASEKSVEEPTPTVEEIQRENYVYSNQVELWKLMKKFDSPVIINREREKYFACTKVMSVYFSQMCHKLNSLEEEYDIILNTRYPETKDKLIPISDLPERLIYEYFENDYLSNKPFEPFSAGAKHKPNILKDVPSEDVETVFTTYFHGKIDKSEPKGKGKGKGKKGKEKSTKSKADKGKKSKKETGKKVKVEKELSIESFNPYAEQFVFNEAQAEEREETPLFESELDVSEKAMKNYKYRQYLTVYTCMSQAVEALVDTIELFECTVSYPTLKEVRDSHCEETETQQIN